MPAFPSIPVIDSFTSGPSQNLTARPGWLGVTPSNGSWATLATDSAPTYAVGTSGTCGNLWGTKLESRQAASFVLSLLPASTVFLMLCRGSTNQDYYTITTSNATGIWKVSKNQNNISTDIQIGGTQIPVTGDSVGFVCDGPVISGQYQAGSTGPWVELVSAYDYSFPGGGYIGMGSNQVTMRWGAVAAGSQGPQGIAVASGSPYAVSGFGG